MRIALVLVVTGDFVKRTLLISSMGELRKLIEHSISVGLYSMKVARKSL